MLILMEEILLVGQCLNAMAHLLGRVGGGGCHQLTLIRQRRHLCPDGFWWSLHLNHFWREHRTHFAGMEGLGHILDGSQCVLSC